MDIVEIDRLDAQPRQAGVQCLGQMRCLVVEAPPLLAGDPALRRDGKGRLSAPALQPVADHGFRPAHAVDVRGVDMGDAKLDTGVQHGHRAFVGRGPIEIGERHRAIAEHADGGASLAQFSLLHGLSFWIRVIRLMSDLRWRIDPIVKIEPALDGQDHAGDADTGALGRQRQRPGIYPWRIRSR